MCVVAAVTCAQPAQNADNEVKIFQRARTIVPYLFVRGHRPKRVLVNSFYFLFFSFWVRIFLFDADFIYTEQFGICMKKKRVPVLFLWQRHKIMGQMVATAKNELRQQKTTIEKVLPSSSIENANHQVSWICHDTQYEPISLCSSTESTDCIKVERSSFAMMII